MQTIAKQDDEYKGLKRDDHPQCREFCACPRAWCAAKLRNTPADAATDEPLQDKPRQETDKDAV